MRFDVLGHVRVLRPDGEIISGGRLRTIILGVLLTNANRPVTVDALTDAAWGDEPDPRAAQKLQVHVHRWRRLLDDPNRLAFVDGTYCLRIAPGELDAERFESLVTEAGNLVATDPAGAEAGKPGEPAPGYVYIDWGPEFYARHSACFPDFIGPALTANIGWLGLQHILEHGGAGYFPLRLVRACLADGRLARCAGAPEFSLPAYMAYASEGRTDFLDLALDAIRRLAAEHVPPSPRPK